jgi:hypothetical protein
MPLLTQNRPFYGGLKRIRPTCGWEHRGIIIAEKSRRTWFACAAVVSPEGEGTCGFCRIVHSAHLVVENPQTRISYNLKDNIHQETIIVKRKIHRLYKIFI